MFVIVAILSSLRSRSARPATTRATVPQQEAEQILAGRAERTSVLTTGGRARSAPDLLRREKRGSLAFLGDFFPMDRTAAAVAGIHPASGA